MLKKALICLSTFLLILSTAWANTPPTEKTTKTDVAPAATQLIVRAKADDKAKVIAKITKPQRLIPFHAKDNWLKIGISDNGQVGWVKKQDLHRYEFAMHHPHFKRTVITQTQDGQGHTVYKVIESNNMQPMNQKQAKKMFQRIMRQQHAMEARMNHLFRMNMAELQPFFMAPRVQIIYLNAPKKNHHHKKEKHVNS